MLKSIGFVCAAVIALASTSADAADTMLTYTFAPGSTFGFGDLGEYSLSGGFVYDATTSTISDVTYTATYSIAKFVFTAAAVNSPTDISFSGDGLGDVDEFFFDKSLATGGTIAITGGNYPGSPVPVEASGAIVSPTSTTVPEPASWAMFIGGFGLIGFTARRRRRVETKIIYA